MNSNTISDPNLSDQCRRQVYQLQETSKRANAQDNNMVCMNCCRGATFVVLEFGIFVCDACARVHHRFHHKGIKSLERGSFTEDDVYYLTHEAGNSRMRKLYFPPNFSLARKPRQELFVSNPTEFQRLINLIIEQIYVDKKFYNGGNNSRYQFVNDANGNGTATTTVTAGSGSAGAVAGYSARRRAYSDTKNRTAAVPQIGNLTGFAPKSAATRSVSSHTVRTVSNTAGNSQQHPHPPQQQQQQQQKSMEEDLLDFLTSVPPVQPQTSLQPTEQQQQQQKSNQWQSQQPLRYVSSHAGSTGQQTSTMPFNPHQQQQYQQQYQQYQQQQQQYQQYQQNSFNGMHANMAQQQYSYPQPQMQRVSPESNNPFDFPAPNALNQHGNSATTSPHFQKASPAPVAPTPPPAPTPPSAVQYQQTPRQTPSVVLRHNEERKPMPVNEDTSKSHFRPIRDIEPSKPSVVAGHGNNYNPFLSVEDNTLSSSGILGRTRSHSANSAMTGNMDRGRLERIEREEADRYTLDDAVIKSTKVDDLMGLARQSQQDTGHRWKINPNFKPMAQKSLH